MRVFRRLGVSLVAVLGVTYLASQLAMSGADVSESKFLVAFRPVAAARPTTPTAAAPAPTTTTTVAPTTTTTAAPSKPEPTTTVRPAAAVAAKATRPAPAPAPASAPAPAAVLAPTAAAAPTTPAAIGAAALGQISYPWQRLGYSVTFVGPNTGLLGKASCGTKAITVYVRPTQTVRQVAFVTAFELGHALDCGTMNDARRGEWAGIRGFAPGWTWFPGCLCTEDNFGSGDISMVFATWLVPNSGYRWRSNLAGPPGASITQLMPYLRPASVG